MVKPNILKGIKGARHLAVPGTICSICLVVQKAFAQEGLRDVKPPVEFPGIKLWMIIVGLLLFSGALLFVFLRKKPKGFVKPEVIVPAWDIAYQELRKLEQSNLLVESQFNEYYVRLSEIVRNYLESRFSLRAAEMTTEEFLEFTKSSDRLLDSQKDTLKEFLILSDLVKFAQLTPNVEDSQNCLKAARNLVDETRVKVESQE